MHLSAHLLSPSRIGISLSLSVSPNPSHILLQLHPPLKMRYENWDVLLFPGASKVPIQEFKTQCFVTRDRGQGCFVQN